MGSDQSLSPYQTLFICLSSESSRLKISAFFYVVGDEDSFMCLKATSDSPQQQQNDQDQEDQSDSAAGIGAPGLTVAPGGQGANEQKDQDDDQDDSHDILLPSSFLEYVLRPPSTKAKITHPPRLREGAGGGECPASGLK